MAVSPYLVALLLAGLPPPAADAPESAPAAVPPAAADAGSLMAIFESLCLSNGGAPAGFETAAWSDFPEALRLMNTYDHGGTFLRRSDPATYIARTEGPGHMAPGVETRCSVAARGIETAGIVKRLKERARAEKTSDLGMGGVTTTLIFGKGGAFTVTRAEDDWVIVRSMGILMFLEPPRRKRK
jgi:hypothetical protein